MNKLNDSSNKSVSVRVGSSGLLTLLFIILKLFGAIEWDWIWVLSPLWISVVLTAIVAIIFLIIAKAKYK